MTLEKWLWYTAIVASLLAAALIALMAYLEHPTSYSAVVWPIVALLWQLNRHTRKP